MTTNPMRPEGRRDLRACLESQVFPWAGGALPPGRAAVGRGGGWEGGLRACHEPPPGRGAPPLALKTPSSILPRFAGEEAPPATAVGDYVEKSLKAASGG